MSLLGFYKKSIYPQTGLFSTTITASIDSSNGLNCEFGFSGNNSIISWACQSGYIFNKKNNEGITGYELIDSYQPGIPFTLSGDFSNKVYNVIINNNIKMIGETIPSTGYFDYFYVNAISGLSDINLKIKGNIPSWDYERYSTYLSGQNILFDIYNYSPWPFKIFSGEIISNTGAFSWSGSNYLIVSGNNTGTYGLMVNNFLRGERIIPLLLHSNFGDINLYVTGSGYFPVTQIFSLDLGPTINTISTNTQNNYIATVLSNTGLLTNISLEYVSGATGIFYENAFRTGVATGEVTGYISGCGFVTGVTTITGWMSGFNPLLGTYESGIGTGFAKFFTCNTGNVTGTGTGMITGYIGTYTGTRQFSGVWNLITGNNDFNVNYRSGNYIVGQNKYFKSSLGGSNFATFNTIINIYVTYNSGSISGSGIYDISRILLTGDGTNSGLYLYITGTN